MKTLTNTTHITPADGNVFLDLGFEPDLAAVLKQESQRIIAEKFADVAKRNEAACPESNISGRKQ